MNIEHPMTAPAKLVTVIIPLRLVEGVYQAEQRLKLILDTIPSDLFDVIVVDYGSGSESARLISETSGGYPNVSVVRVDAEMEMFSIGVARDIGVQHSRSPIIMFNDIDFYAPTEMYRRVHAEIRCRRMEQNIYDFFCVPVIWTTEASMERFDEIRQINDPEAFIYEYHSAVVERKKDIVDVVAYGSSAIVANKYNYLSLGGHNRKFYGHGAEDYDLLHRLAATNPKGPRTGNYYKDTKDNGIQKYEGFRAYFATYGVDVFQRGLFFIHMWHPRRPMQGYFQSKRNFDLLGSLMVDFDKNKKQPLPLADLTRGEKTLLLVDPMSRVAGSFRYAMPFMGDVHMVAEKLFTDGDALVSFFEKEGFTKIGFLTPYGNPHRLMLYKTVRREKIPYWVFDRGALPDSWFFDPNGFNADSATYDPEKWDVPWQEDEQRKCEELIRNLRLSDDTLEANGARRMPIHLREMFGLMSQKIIFVPLQRPSDSVMKYFADPVGGMENFCDWISYIAERLDPFEWAIVIKKHPLEQDIPEISNVYIAPPDCHIHDLLDLADKVMLVNSGTGVLSMAFEKPVIYCGTPFYRAEGVNYAATSKEQALELASSSLPFNADRAQKFLNYLYNHVYSFGPSSYEKLEQPDGSSITIVTRILYRELRGLTEKPVIMGNVRSGLSLDAPLFYSFGGRPGVQDAVKIPSPRPAVLPTRRIAPTPRRAHVVTLRKGVLLDEQFPADAVPPLPFAEIAQGWGLAGQSFEHRIQGGLDTGGSPITIVGRSRWHLGEIALIEVSEQNLVLQHQGTGTLGTHEAVFAVRAPEGDIGNCRILVDGEVVPVTPVSRQVGILHVVFAQGKDVVMTLPGASSDRIYCLELLSLNPGSAGDAEQVALDELVTDKMIKSVVLNPLNLLGTGGGWRLSCCITCRSSRQTIWNSRPPCKYASRAI
ncbi:MAG: hypothetical protein U5N10_10660 [Gemmobacter sp.]|nr:hypothetical protein [Gemmobacter sp.]